MNPVLVDSTHCHLWTDALHIRQLAREAANRWDRGTYVRLCVSLAWTALEIGCQEALDDPKIGYSFKVNLDKAIANQRLSPLDWSQGVWQQVRRLQEVRKTFVHRFRALDELFPDCEVADDAVVVARDGIAAVFAHASKKVPAWINFDASHGWARNTGASDVAHACIIVGGVNPNEPTAIRVCYVVEQIEHVSGIYPKGFDHAAEVERLVKAVNVPISAIRVYEGKALIRELLVEMRGNQ